MKTDYFEDLKNATCIEDLFKIRKEINHQISNTSCTYDTFFQLEELKFWKQLTEDRIRGLIFNGNFIDKIQYKLEQK